MTSIDSYTILCGLFIFKGVCVDRHGFLLFLFPLRGSSPTLARAYRLHGNNVGDWEPQTEAAADAAAATRCTDYGRCVWGGVCRRGGGGEAGGAACASRPACLPPTCLLGTSSFSKLRKYLLQSVQSNFWLATSRSSDADGRLTLDGEKIASL